MFYAAQEKIPYVSLSDQEPPFGGPEWFHLPWRVLTALLTRFNAPRADNLLYFQYWRRHYLYYGSQWCIFLAIPLGSFFWKEKDLNLWIAVGASIFSFLLYYVFGAWLVLRLRRQYLAFFGERRDLALQAWEYILWSNWEMQAMAFALISKVDYAKTETRILGLNTTGSWSLEGMGKFYAHPATIAFAWALMLTGTLVKTYACYLSGMNNYYCYDMILNKPNERFVDSGLYKYFSSPTYHLGYIDGYGMALFLQGYLQNGSPTLCLLFVAASHVGICVVNRMIEQPSVKAMYHQTSQSLII